MSPKYRQRGYQDEEPRERSTQRGPTSPTDRSGPRGRGLGAPTSSAFRCAACGEKQRGEIGPESTCDACGDSLHSCVNCRHFDSAARFECRQEIPERVASKRKRNDCGIFEKKIVAERVADATQPSEGHAAFDALFKGL